MAPSQKQQVLGWFFRALPEAGVHDFAALLRRAAEDSLGLSGLDLDAFLASRETGLWNALRSEQEARARDGLSVAFDMLEGHQMRWHSMATAASHSEALRLLRLRSRPPILRAIDALTWRQYEALGCEVAVMCGATELHLTPPGNECGVDFFAIIQQPGNNHVFSGGGSLLRVIGQSKKYDSRVEVERVKAFNDTISDVKRREPTVTAIVPAWFLAHRGPIVGWMVSHSGFQSGARSRAHNLGILASDTVDLAEISALSRVLELSDSPQDRVRALVDKIDARLV